MVERRKHNRISIQVPVRLKAIGSGKGKVLDLSTKNISYAGVFIPTITPFEEGKRFKLDFTLPTDNLKEFQDIKSLMSCAGRVVRSTSLGIAIKFDRECQIESLKAL